MSLPSSTSRAANSVVVPFLFIVVGHRPAAPRLQGQARLGAVERLDLRLLINAEHHRVRRRVDVEPDDVAQLGDEFRIARELELPHPMRLEPVSAPDTLIRCTEERLIPAALAMAAPVQWVVSPGGSVWVSATTRSATAGGSGATRDRRVLSRNNPSTPSCMNRSCRRHRQVLLLPARRMISLVPRPSRSTARSGLATHASEGCSEPPRSPQAGRDRQNSHRRCFLCAFDRDSHVLEPPESPTGLFRQICSTSLRHTNRSFQDGKTGRRRAARRAVQVVAWAICYSLWA